MGERRIIGITMGDISGIGPELILKVFSEPELVSKARLLVVGCPNALERAMDLIGIRFPLNIVEKPSDGIYKEGMIDVLSIGEADLGSCPIGEVASESGMWAYKAVEKVIELAMKGEIDATVTNPLNKEALHKAGYNYPGHTEIYASLTGSSKFSMMLIHGNLRVMHVSTHVSLRQACDLVKKDRVLDVIRLANSTMLDLGIKEPRIAVAGLNPHAGENGLFGMEEIEEITPAIEEARSQGINAIGPIPPDTVFSKAVGGWYDAVIAMYHDQGHIPLKVKGFVYDEKAGKWLNVAGINVTLGLPIIRVSVDHGTAFDQAGKGTASPSSLIESIEYAIRFAENRRKDG